MKIEFRQSKTRPYNTYCEWRGISPDEKDPIVLLPTIAHKGPSSFIFAPVTQPPFTKDDLFNFRKELKLSIREFADLFDFSPATIQKIEKGKMSGKDSLKRIELYFKFSETALMEVNRSGFKINDRSREYVESILKKKITTSDRQ